MSDSSSYVNAYIDNAVGMLHEHISTILNLKAQNKVITDLVALKDAQIVQLAQSLENERLNRETNNDELVVLRNKNQSLESTMKEYDKKLSHMNTLLKQVSEMKNIILEKDKELQKFLPKKPEVIMNKKSPTQKPIETKVITSKETADDF